MKELFFSLIALLRPARDDLHGWQFRLLGVGAVLLADQASKMAAIVALQVGESVQLLPFFSLTSDGQSGHCLQSPWWSRPASAGAFVGHDYPVLSCLDAPCRTGGHSSAWGSGLHRRRKPLGNLADRVRYGEVVDFLHLHAGGRSFPVFNLADTALTIGAILLITDFLSPPTPRASSGLQSRADTETHTSHHTGE